MGIGHILGLLAHLFLLFLSVVVDTANLEQGGVSISADIQGPNGDYISGVKDGYCITLLLLSWVVWFLWLVMMGRSLLNFRLRRLQMMLIRPGIRIRIHLSYREYGLA